MYISGAPGIHSHFSDLFIIDHIFSGAKNVCKVNHLIFPSKFHKNIISYYCKG